MKIYGGNDEKTMGNLAKRKHNYLQHHLYNHND